VRAALLGWFDRGRRPLALREDRSPYRVLVAEVMSQQTRAEAVAPHLEAFLARYPSPALLAQSAEDDVLHAWRGLGYYRRALLLRQAAAEIVRCYGGEVPADPGALRALPGVGPYVAGAVASFAFGADEPALDANASRVLCRLFGLRGALDRAAGRRALEGIARRALPPGRSAEWNEALMDLGALVCLPRAPRCAACPLAPLCRALADGDAAQLPVRRPRRPARELPVSVLLLWHQGRWAVRRRPADGLLAGMWEFPTVEGAETAAAAAAAVGVALEAVQVLPPFRHGFTHRTWRVHPFRARLRARGAGTPPAALRWVTAEEVAALALAGPSARLAAGAGRAPAKM
jgi:A/G-specific adenine glycosylase